MKALIVVYLTALALLSCHPVAAAEKQYKEIYDEIYTTDGARELVLTIKPCPLKENFGYLNYAYVLGKEGIVQEACWQPAKAGDYDVWIPEDKKFYVIPSKAFAPRGQPRRVEVLPEATL